MTTDRRLEILRAIVDEYVETQEPVGSKAIAEKRALGISPATIRNEMAVLEEEGFITQPHTSAGRIPTDRGYRLFVDKLSAVKPLSTAERRAIETFLEGAHDLDEVVKRSAKLLADITKQVAVVKYPKIGDSSDAHPTVHVTIGSEQQDMNLQTTSLVSVGYGSDASLGILGPTRMDYAGSMAAVSAVARYVGRFITESAQ
ncbi:MAG: heat-inducible transcriptional repressor HrcA [Actinobacteria bacterium]|nr:heat-inducible transcriptional repressor HrcA [Actinomycetota bacterium]